MPTRCNEPDPALLGRAPTPSDMILAHAGPCLPALLGVWEEAVLMLSGVSPLERELSQTVIALEVLELTRVSLPLDGVTERGGDTVKAHCK